MNDDEYVELNETVSLAAKTVAKKWPGAIESDDMHQQLLEMLMSNSSTVSMLMDMESEIRYANLVRLGNRIAADEMDAYAVFSGNVYYGTKDVRSLLDELDVARVPTEHTDLHLAMEQLWNENRTHYDTLVGEYWIREPVQNRKHVQRAVDRLTVLMNRINRSTRYEPKAVPQ